MSKKRIETLHAEYSRGRAQDYVTTYKECLDAILNNPYISYSALPKKINQIEAVRQAEKDADYILRTKQTKKKK